MEGVAFACRAILEGNRDILIAGASTAAMPSLVNIQVSYERLLPTSPPPHHISPTNSLHSYLTPSLTLSPRTWTQSRSHAQTSLPPSRLFASRTHKCKFTTPPLSPLPLCGPLQDTPPLSPTGKSNTSVHISTLLRALHIHLLPSFRNHERLCSLLTIHGQLWTLL